MKQTGVLGVRRFIEQNVVENTLGNLTKLMNIRIALENKFKDGIHHNVDLQTMALPSSVAYSCCLPIGQSYHLKAWPRPWQRSVHNMKSNVNSGAESKQPN